MKYRCKCRELRRGWFVGREGFLEQLQEKLGAIVAGKQRESQS
jgi:hypothetical protein